MKPKHLIISVLSFAIVCLNLSASAQNSYRGRGEDRHDPIMPSFLFSAGAKDLDIHSQFDIFILSEWLKMNPSEKIHLNSFINPFTGTYESSRQLCRERMNAIANVLIGTYGINRDRVGVNIFSPDEIPDRENFNFNLITISLQDDVNKYQETVFLPSILFTGKSTEIQPSEINDIVTIGNWMRDNKDKRIKLSGSFCGGYMTGNATDNTEESKQLTKLRLNEVASYLINNMGIQRDRFSIDNSRLEYLPFKSTDYNVGVIHFSIAD